MNLEKKQQRAWFLRLMLCACVRVRVRVRVCYLVVHRRSCTRSAPDPVSPPGLSDFQRSAFRNGVKTFTMELLVYFHHMRCLLHSRIWRTKRRARVA